MKHFLCVCLMFASLNSFVFADNPSSDSNQQAEDQKQKEFERMLALLKLVPSILKGTAVVVVAGGVVVGVIFFIKWLRNDKVDVLYQRLDDLEDNMEEVIKIAKKMDGLDDRIRKDTDDIVATQKKEIELLEGISVSLKENVHDILRRVDNLEKNRIFKKFRRNSHNSSQSSPRSSNNIPKVELP